MSGRRPLCPRNRGFLQLFAVDKYDHQVKPLQVDSSSVWYGIYLWIGLFGFHPLGLFTGNFDIYICLTAVDGFVLNQMRKML